VCRLCALYAHCLSEKRREKKEKRKVEVSPDGDIFIYAAKRLPMRLCRILRFIAVGDSLTLLSSLFSFLSYLENRKPT